MQRAEVEARVFRIVAAASEGRIAARDLTVDVSFRRDLGLDSVGVLRVLDLVSVALGTGAFDLAELFAETPVYTVGDLVALAERLGRRAEEAS
jgi:acyl carrier protein